ncbi:MAG: YafY family transcriptional regulator [Bryobacterales bacterium]|nr:YafY family transcriptional regulator [Bryobacterales bacterium]
MRRADRLFQILMLLRNRRVVTAREIAERLEISERTVYRDMQDLSLSGVPLESEAGIGYRLKPGFDLPPLMFNEEELAALRLGAAIVRAWADDKLAKAADSALERIEAVLPEKLQRSRRHNYLQVPDFFVSGSQKHLMSTIREAIAARTKMRIEYARADGENSQRIIEPLGLFYWGAKWTIGAWCDLRRDFRTFRLDRVSGATVLDQSCAHTLDEYLETCTAED